MGCSSWKPRFVKPNKFWAWWVEAWSGAGRRVSASFRGHGLPAHLTFVPGRDAKPGAYWPGPGPCMAPSDSNSVSGKARVSGGGGRAKALIRNRRPRLGATRGDDAAPSPPHATPSQRCAPSGTCDDGGRCAERRLGDACGDLRDRPLRLEWALPGGGPARNGEIGGCPLSWPRSARPLPPITQRNLWTTLSAYNPPPLCPRHSATV